MIESVFRRYIGAVRLLVFHFQTVIVSETDMASIVEQLV